LREGVDGRKETTRLAAAGKNQREMDVVDAEVWRCRPIRPALPRE
jgi:hypothetical protein